MSAIVFELEHVNVLTWCSDDEGKVPEQVHLLLTPRTSIPQIPPFVLRVKSAAVMLELLRTLEDHAGDVWPAEFPRGGS